MINQTIVMYVVAGVLAVLLIVLVLEFFLLRNKLNRQIGRASCRERV